MRVSPLWDMDLNEINVVVCLDPQEEYKII